MKNELPYQHLFPQAYERMYAPYRNTFDIGGQIVKETFEERPVRSASPDGKALWVLADHMIPPDIIESAKRWRMEETIKEMWRSAFIQGWRSAHKTNE
jgi:hypothetical protein